MVIKSSRIKWFALVILVGIFSLSISVSVTNAATTNATFSRSSVSYKQDGIQVAAETPRFENGKFGQALMVEEGTQNLLTANQSSVETDLSGFSTWSQTGQHMISRDASTAWHGSASTKLTNNIAGNNVMAVGTGAQKTAVTGGQTYTFSVHTKSNVTGRAWTVKIHWFDSSGNFIKTDEPGWTNTATSWTVQTVTATAPSNAASASCEEFLSATASGDAVWWDGAQLEKEAFATSWIPGGTTRSPESLAIPTAGVWNKGNWQLDLIFEPTSSQVRAGSWKFLFGLEIDGGNYYSLAVHPDGRPYLVVKSNGVEYNTYSTLDPVLQVGQKYHLTIRGDGYKMALLINGVASASGSKPYVEPVGTLPEKMNIGMVSWGARANGLYDDLRISSRARTDQEIANAYNKNIPLPVDADTLYKMDFDNSLQSTVSAIRVTNATFSRSSVSYKRDGTQVAAETPRFENGKFGQTLMVEEGTQNLLTANQSSVETDLSGFSTWSQTGQHAISRDASTAWHGSASTKLTNHTAGNNVMVVGTGAQKTAVTGGQAYTFSVHTKSNVTGRAWTVKIHWFDSSGNFIRTDEPGWTNTATSWTVQTVTATAPSNAASASCELFLSATASGDAVWWDGAQLEKEAFATSWIPGGTTRSPESLAIPTAGVWNKGNWQMDFVFEPTSSQVRAGSWKFLFGLEIDGGNYYSLAVHPDGRPYLVVKSNGVEYNTYSTLDPVLQVGQKYHLTICGDGSKMALLINGVVSASGSKPYVEPVGTLPEKMNIGMVSWGGRANGLYDDLHISSRARTDQEIANAYNKNIPLPVDADTLYKMDFDNSLQSTVSAIRVTNATFSRSSVSYKRDGTQVAAETPRFENGKFGQTLMVEEGTQNLLTANQSSVETDLSGFSTWSQTGQHAISRDASTAWHGSASTKLTNNTAGNNVMAVGTGAQKTAVIGGQAYTFSVHTKSNVTGRAWTAKIHWFDSSGNFIRTDEPGWTNTAISWTVQTVTATAPSNAASASCELFLSATASGDAVWWDGAQLEKEASATSWIPGGTTRSPESLAIPAAEVWNKGNWQLDLIFEPTSSQVRPGSWRFLFALGIDASNGYSLIIHPDGRPYLAASSNGVEYNTYNTLDPVLQVGEKYHLTIRGDGSKMALLINGVLSASGSKPYIEPVGTLPEKMYIGMVSWGARANGLYDDLRISSRARTDQEIVNAYNKNVPLPIDADTVYKMDFDNSLQSTVSAIQISPDKYESNDTIGEALNIAQGTLTSYINIFDVDYYKITTPIDGNLIISLKGPTGTNFDLQLLDSNGALLQSSNGDGPNELISQALSKSNTYYIKVYGVNDAFSLIPYQLELNYPYEYVYDASNRLDFINLLSGKLIDYQYDNNGNLIQSIKR